MAGEVLKDLEFKDYAKIAIIALIGLYLYRKAQARWADTLPPL